MKAGESHGTHRTALVEVALVFLKLGFTSFGGPAAHIAMMEEEAVRRRGWVTREHFLDLLGATNLIPGPNSTELAIHLGHHRAGWAGLVVGGVCFIAPAMAIVLAIAWAYVRFGTLPQTHALLYGVKPVVVAVVIQALGGSGTALKSRRLIALGVAAVLLAAGGTHELLILLACGVVQAFARWKPRSSTDVRPPELNGVAPLFPLSAVLAGSAAPAATPYAAGTLFLFFLKVGSVLFGSGYVLLAFLRADLVDRLRWLTEAQLLDAIAVGQVTPGPVFTTATFIGYVLGGPSGATLATIGIFLPAFFFVAVSGPLIPRLRRSAIAGAVLDGVNVGSLALMAVVTAQLARAALVDPVTIALAAASIALLFRFRVNSAWLVLAGGVVGLLR